MNKARALIEHFWMSSIRRQLILGIALVHAVLMTIFVADLVDRQREFLHAQSIAQAEGLAKTLASSSVSWILASDVAGLAEVLQSQSGFPELRYAMLLNPRGKVIGHTDKSKRNLYLSDSVSRNLLNGEARAQTLVADNKLVDIAYPILIEDELIGWARVGVGQEKITAGLFKISFNGIIYTVLAILVGSIFAYLMAKSLTSGLRHLIDVAEGNRLGRRELRADLSRADEIGLLGRDLNQMLDALSKQEQELRAHEAELRKITDVLPAPVARLDIHGNYLFVSAAYARWFGKLPAEVIGHTQRESVSAPIYEKVSPYFERALAGEKVTFEISVNTPAGETLHGQVSALPDYDAAGKICGFFVIVADITQRKQAEQNAQNLRDQLAQATKMEAVGQLTAGIAHDFNNMLGAIMGFSGLAKMMLTAGKPEKLEGYLNEVINSSQRAKELIAQMLTFSRLQADAEDSPPPTTLLEPTLKEVVSLLRSSIPTTIELNYQVDEPGLKARINPVQLHQIMLNLGINARDAIGEYGKIDITLSHRQVAQQTCASCQYAFSGDFIELTVSDTGSGIDAQNLKNIFNPFFTTKEIGKGTGMGLSVVHGLVHNLGGHIQLASQPGKGTRFSILLPASAATANNTGATADIAQDAASLAGLRIMLVDDERAMTAMLHEYLGLHGAKISAFNSPLDALAAFKQHPEQFDIVITDETMPELSGMHLAEQMLQLKPRLPIILCTGYSERATPDLAKKAGLAGFFYKPLNIHELMRRITQLRKQAS